jgi:hypothetical protein
MTTRKLSAQSRAKIKKALEVLATAEDKPIYQIRVRPDPLEIYVSAAEFAEAITGNIETDLDEITSLLYWLSGDFPEEGSYTHEVIEVATGRVVEVGDNLSLAKKL